jgi:hypothetical protein
VDCPYNKHIATNNGQQMKHTQLVAAFASVNGGSFVGIDTLVEVKLTGGKANPQQGRVTKRQVGSQVMVFSNQKTNAYAAMIERRLVAEGKDPASFTLSPRAWGTRIPDMPIVEHFKDGVTKYYLEVIYLKAGAVEYRLDGAPIAESEIIGLPVATAGQQGGLDNKVIIRTFAADSITEVRVDGKVYQ